MAKKVNLKIDFEKSMEELEKIVGDLESGTLTLDQSIEAFERGIELSKLCQKRLEAAEERVKKLLEKTNGEIGLELFEEEEGNTNG
ncbi:MAG TPA: exodeoxyribonuclease VII small subunit [candidate division Zixibacteria bacterium]|nr:exodeoxyribonuclease VII small subunit [candidate division Zixibacteria bacterium]HBZ00802.1 exodeoxyribonuclease VII small subunit [candidate division Zixibacteria bacterium]